MPDIPIPATWVAGTSEPAPVEEDDSLADPNDGKPLQRRLSSSPDQVERALAAAATAHADGRWSDAGMKRRADVLHRFADAVDAAAEEIAVLDALNSGVPIRYTRMFAGSLGDTVRKAVELGAELGDEADLPADQGAVRLRHVPWGPTALVLPWNAPSAVAVKKMAYALMAGAPVIVKPSPFSPWSAELLARAAASSGFPDGVVNTVLGGADVGAQLCGDRRVRAISMTGSTPTGRTIAAAAAPHFTRLRLELGSNNPVVVRADAAIQETAQSLFDGMTKLNGQWCEAPRNVYAVGSTAADLVEALGSLAMAAEVGSSLDEATQVGPMAYRARRDELVAQRESWQRDGHTVRGRTEVQPEGWFFGPTVVAGDDIRVTDEVFGPMITVEAVADDDEAVARANRTAGGLAAYVFGGDLDAALSVGTRLLGGEVKINGTSLLDMSPLSAQSFFGSSGLGGHGDRDVLDFYLGKQVVGVDLVGAPL